MALNAVSSLMNTASKAFPNDPAKMAALEGMTVTAEVPVTVVK